MTKTAKYDVVIVGSGFAGIVAAGILADHQLNILLVDENIHLGGQLLRNIPDSLGQNPAAHPDYVKKIGFQLVQNIKQKKITLMNRTCVVGIYPENRLMLESQRKEILDVTGDVILFATGARERFLPFPGWTLPGVYSAGMAQVMMKSSGLMPAREILIGGTGLFLFSVGYEFLKNKGRVTAILEQAGRINQIKMLPALLHQSSKLVEGIKYYSRFLLSGVPVKYRHKILEARGDGQLEEVVTGKINGNGQLIPGSEKTYRTHALAVGYGFVPNIEAPQSAGCRLEFLPHHGGWVTAVNDGMETSVENILAAGEITGVGGALKSLNEGQIAAATILEKFNKINRDQYKNQLEKLTRKRRHHMDFVRHFNRLFGLPPALIRDIPGDTVVCRCEDITVDTIRNGIAAGYTTPAALKSGMRLFMGNCQGRTCGPVVYDLLQTTLNHAVTPEPLRVRPPLKPVSIGALSHFTGKGNPNSTPPQCCRQKPAYKN